MFLCVSPRVYTMKYRPRGDFKAATGRTIAFRPCFAFYAASSKDQTPLFKVAVTFLDVSSRLGGRQRVSDLQTFLEQ